MTNNSIYTKLRELLLRPEHQKVLLEAFSLITDIIRDSSVDPKEHHPKKQHQFPSNEDTTHTDSPPLLEVEEDLVMLKRKEARELGIELQDINWYQRQPTEVLLALIQKKIDEFNALPIIEPSKTPPIRPQRSMEFNIRKSKRNLTDISLGAQNTTLEEAESLASKILEEDD